MAELRWTLLGIGALFVVGLLLWERYKRGRAASSGEPASHNEVSDAQRARDPRHEAVRDPSVTQPLAKPMDHKSLDAPLAAAAGAELPIIDMETAQARTAANQAARRGAAPVFADDLDDADDAEYLRQPLDADDADMRGMRVESMSELVDHAGRAEQWIAAAGVRALRSEDLVLDWPADDQRSVLTLRLEARGSERLGGRIVRQSLLGEGFIFGKMDIFHLPLADGRVVCSAASLTKPGAFTLAGMDSQTFLGLNLFAVLPGPLSGVEALERLVASGRLLAQRLRADLLDSQGRPLSEARLLEMRASLANTRAAPEPVAVAARADRV